MVTDLGGVADKVHGGDARARVDQELADRPQPTQSSVVKGCAELLVCRVQVHPVTHQPANRVHPVSAHGQMQCVHACGVLRLASQATPSIEKL